ncbi:hypothetical protein Tco_0251130 [Tanacetum coccineum]
MILITMKMEILLETTSNKLMVEHAEFDESDTHVLERFDTLAGNPIKEILLKLNLPDHRSILTDSKILKDGGEVKEFQRSFRHSDTERLSRSDEVLKLKNFKKDATLKLFKSTNQERYEHVGPEVTSSQDGQGHKMAKKRLCLVDDLKDAASYDCITSMDGDLITELFGVSLTTPNDIDAFTSDLEAAETPIKTNVNPMPSKVSASDPIVQYVFINEKPSSYVGAALWSKPKASKSKANLRSLFFENVCEGVRFSIPRKVVETVFSEDGLSIIASQLGVPLIEGTGYTIETVTIEYEWQPYRCDLCKIFGHIYDHCPKTVSMPTIVVTSNISTPTVEKTNDEFQTVKSPRLMLILPLDDENEKDVKNVYDESANLFLNSKTGGSSSFAAAAG